LNVEKLNNVETLNPENTTGRPQGQLFPQTPFKAFRQSDFVIFRASSFGRFRPACPRNSAQASLAGLARV